MLRKQETSIMTLALLVALAAAHSPLSALLAVDPALAQSPSPPTAFPLPSTLPTDLLVKIDGSSSMAVVNQSLKNRFENQYQGTTVELAAAGTDAALKALLDGQIDLVAVGRPLTAAEKSQGLTEVPISREKIAIIVGPNNPLSGDLTFEQFAKMFRGEITDWSQVGGAPGPIRLVDRPNSSDTRLALSRYAVFQAAPFETGATITQAAADDTAAVIQDLGADDISYAIASQVLDQADVVKIVPMHKTLPDNPKYPYSQPRGYVYKAAPSPAVLAFLGFATSAAGQAAIAQARQTEAAAIAPTAPATPAATATPIAPAPDAVASPDVVAASTVAVSPTAASDGAAVPATDKGVGWLLWLLPLLALVGGGWWWWLKGRRPEPAVSPAASPESAAVPPAAVLPGVAAPEPALSPMAAVGAIGAAGAVGAIALGAALVGNTSPKSQIILTPRSISDAYAYWETPEAHKAELREKGGQDLTLRLYDVTDIDFDQQPARSVQSYRVAELDQDRHVPILATNRDYLAEIGYWTADQQWLSLARSNTVRVAAAIAPLVSPVAPEPEPPVTEAAPDPTAIAIPPVIPPAVPETPPVTPPPVDANLPAIAAVLAGGAAMAAAAAAAALDRSPEAEQSMVEATKFDVGQTDLSAEDLADVDVGLADLPEGYGESRMVLMPRDPQWGYAYWDIPNEHREAVRQRGGQRLALRLYDVTSLDINSQRPHSLQQYECDELARTWYVPIPVSDRDYLAEIGYLTPTGDWLLLARSNPIRIPPVYPSDWFEDQFMTLEWNNDLAGRTFLTLIPPDQRTVEVENPLYDEIFGMAQAAESMRLAGSLFGSMQQVPGSVFGSMQMASGSALESVPTGFVPGAVSSYGFASGIGMSGIGMSGIGMSGIGFGASMPPIRARKFWLIADAELIVYGATEPDATVTIAGRPVKLNPDGTFRFHMSFQDGLVDFPILAVAIDGVQTRSIHMKFNRDTPERRTNTRDEATDESY